MPPTEPKRPPLDLDRLAAASWGRVQVVDSAPSTNVLVADRARDGEAEGLVVAAEHQTAGRGRLDRTWVTPARTALTCSVLLRPSHVPAERWSWLPLLVGVCVARAARRVGAPAVLKWPNDVLVGERKLAGILLERLDTPDGPATVAGIGANVAMTTAELPVPGATSLAIEGCRTDRTTLLLGLLEELGRSYAGWVDAGGDPGQGLRADYTELCVTLGRPVRVEVAAGPPVEGVAEEVDATGRLVVATDSGRTTLGAGDVVHVRAAHHPAE